MSINKSLIKIFHIYNVIFIDDNTKLNVLMKQSMKKLLFESSANIKGVYQKKKICIKPFMFIEYFF